MGDHGPRTVLDELRRRREAATLEEACRDLGIVLLVAFGSAVDERVTEPGDLDLAVLLEADRDLVEVVSRMMAWLASDDIDVLDLARADVVVRYEALAGTELLYQRDSDTFDELEIAAVLRMADTRWLRELRLEVLAR
ncbi:MAG: nucleotidyltransferase domain-containing protein [Egibacteraceae bacterium]